MSHLFSACLKGLLIDDPLLGARGKEIALLFILQQARELRYELVLVVGHEAVGLIGEIAAISGQVAEEHGYADRRSFQIRHALVLFARRKYIDVEGVERGYDIFHVVCEDDILRKVLRQWFREKGAVYLPEPDKGFVGLAIIDFYLWPVVIRPWGQRKNLYKWPYYFSRSKKRIQGSQDLAANWAAEADRIIEKRGKNVAIICMEELDEELAKNIQPKTSNQYPASITNNAERAFYDNLNKNESLANYNIALPFFKNNTDISNFISQRIFKLNTIK